MDDVRFGLGVRAIRLRAGLRQMDVARGAGVSQAAVSDVERGRGDRLSLRTLRAVVQVLGAQATLELRWRGGELDRLLDERHATLVSRTVGILEGLGWTTVVEATYSRFGERGSFDILAFHRTTGVALAVEVKSRLVSLEATLRKIDEKARLAPEVVVERFAMRPRVVGRMLVLPEGGVARRALTRHDEIIRRAFSLRGTAARAWLGEPAASAALLLLVRAPSPPRPGRPRSDQARSASPARRSSPRGLAVQPAPHPITAGTLESRHGDRRDVSIGDTRRRGGHTESPR